MVKKDSYVLIPRSYITDLNSSGGLIHIVYTFCTASSVSSLPKQMLCRAAGYYCRYRRCKMHFQDLEDNAASTYFQWQRPALWYRHVITWHDENYSAPAIQRFLIGCYDADWLLKAGYPPYHTWKVIHTMKTQLQQWYWCVHHSIKNRWGLERQNTTNNVTDIFWNCDTSTVVFCTNIL